MTATTIKGVGKVDSDDVYAPKIKILQGIDKIVAEKGLPVGKLYNTSTQKALDSVIIVPIMRTKEHWGVDVDNKLEFKATSKDDPRFADKSWKKEGTVPATAFTVITHKFLLKGTDEIVEMLLKKTGLSAHRELMSLILGTGKPPWAFSYKLSSKKADGKAYFVPVIEQLEENDAATQEIAEAYFDQNNDEEDLPI